MSRTKVIAAIVGPGDEILEHCGELGLVGGQEDMIIDIAIGSAEEL